MTNYSSKLTRGALGHMLSGTTITDPVLQMLAFKNMPTDNAQRYRLVLSDGVYSYQCCIIMGELAIKIETGEFDRYCLLKISRYMLNEIQGRQVIVLADPKLLVKGSQIKEKLSDPVPFGTASAPPLSNFKANYHLECEDSMDMELGDDDDFFGDDADTNSAKNRATTFNDRNKVPQTKGAMNGRKGYNSSSNSSMNQLNPELACPITSLTPYSNKWLIKGRVVGKSAKRTWSNAKGEGTLFSFDLKDATADIRVTAFNAECNQLFDSIKLNQIYLVSKGVIKATNRNYTSTISSYEITLNQDSIVELCHDQSSCPQMETNFVPFDRLTDHIGNYVDVIGVIKEIGTLESITSKKNQKQFTKRNITLCDQSKCEVMMTIWNELAIEFPAEIGDVFMSRVARVSDFNLVSLSTTINSINEINPPIPEAHSLKGWYSRTKDSLETKVLTEKKTGISFRADWQTFSHINAENVQRENAIVLQNKATIYQIGKATVYKSCECNKKLVDLNNGFYRCDKCAKETDKFQWRMLLQIGLADHTQNIWVRVFHELIVKLLGERDIDEIGNLYETNPSEAEEVLRSINFSSYIFKLRAKMEHFNDDTRVSIQATAIAPVNHRQYFDQMMKEIAEYSF